MPAKISFWAYVLAVADINKSAAYYRDVLGFQVQWTNAADWRLVDRDGVRIMLGLCPDDMPAVGTGSHNWFGYLDVDDVNALHGELTSRGANVTAPKDTHYGMREIVVTTLDGHRLVFGQPMTSAG